MCGGGSAFFFPLVVVETFLHLYENSPIIKVKKKRKENVFHHQSHKVFDLFI